MVSIVSLIGDDSDEGFAKQALIGIMSHALANIVKTMSDTSGFDPTFDFRTDASGGDPDSNSPTLKRYHKLLWSKPLPSGDPFELDDTTPGAYLHHSSSRGEFYLASDSAMPTWTRWRRMTKLLSPIPEPEREQFRTLAYQMGGMMIFPSRRIDGKRSINEERGINTKIVDRLDLTVECIRLHYLRETNPMAETLIRYGDFFALFEDFKGYTDFFLLQDLVSEDLSTVRFFGDNTGFGAPALPSTLDAYQDYRVAAIEFVGARNRRMADFAASG